MKKDESTKNNKRSIKNYVVFVLMILGCMAVTLYLCKLYKVNDAKKKKTPIIDGMLSEIYNDDLGHYLT